MRGHNVSFLADRSDLEALLSRIDQGVVLTFTERLSRLNEECRQLHGARTLMELVATSEGAIPEQFLITRGDAVVTYERVIMKDGAGQKWRADPLLHNLDGILVLLGGVDTSAQTLMPTSINTSGDTDAAKALFKQLKKYVVSSSILVQGFYVFPGGLAKHREGWRLAGGWQVSRSLDVVVPPGLSP